MKHQQPGWANRLLSMLQSTLAAAFGVQSSKKREQDFQEGNLWMYIIFGVIFTLIFILCILAVVNLVLP